MPKKTYFVYMMSSLKHRVAQHKKKLVPGFTQRYNLFKLVHYEMFSDIRLAITREKQIKGWLRSKKVALIVEKNPEWKDLAADWYKTEPKRQTLSS